MNTILWFIFFCFTQLKKLVEKPAEPVPNVMENGDGGDDEGNEWQVRLYLYIEFINNYDRLADSSLKMQ